MAEKWFICFQIALYVASIENKSYGPKRGTFKLKLCEREKVKPGENRIHQIRSKKSASLLMTRVTLYKVSEEGRANIIKLNEQGRQEAGRHTTACVNQRLL